MKIANHFGKALLILLTTAFAAATVAAAAGGPRKISKLTKTVNAPMVTIHDIQFVSDSALHICDSLGYANTTQWKLQVSPYMGDTVLITALVTVPPSVITYTNHGLTMEVVDTGALGSQPWSGVLVRWPLSYSDDNGAAADAAGFLNVQQGDIIQMFGTVSEFPTGQMNSLTQFAPLTDSSVIVVSSGNPLPAPVHLSITEFNKGQNDGSGIKFSTGEKWEGKEVYFTDVTVTGNVNTSRGTFEFVDDQGNHLSDYDWSYHFTLDTGQYGSPDRTGSPHDTTYHVPPLGTRIDTIRGYISTSSGGESKRGYRICPIFPGDIVYGQTKPGLSTHRRYPIIVAKDSTPLITVKAYKQAFNLQAADLDTVQIFYSVNNGAWQTVGMTASQPAVDSLYQGHIPAQSVGSTVRYFVKVTDKDTLSTIYANAGGLTQLDSSAGFFFYKVLDRTAQPVLTIQDIQTTPYINGRSPYVGAVDSVGGIVTADSSSLLLSPRSTDGSNAYYIQSGTQKFSGLWVVNLDTLSTQPVNGDSVVVTGTIAENFDVTRMEGVKALRIVSHGNPLPAPVKLKTSVFGPAASNGNLAAEPYESMLVEFDSVRITNIAPVYQQPDFSVMDNSGVEMFVHNDGRNTFTTDTSDHAGTLLSVGSKISKLVGIIYFTNSRYKLEPRTNDDFGIVTSVRREDFVLPQRFTLDQNFPNPFNPATTIRYSIPAESKVVLKVYNLIGQEVATLVNTDQRVGTYSVQFDASKLASGVYFYRLSAGSFVQTKKLLLLK
ncbi:MAG: T9SS type A sorting domain-containing protein [Bacteroidota bacterium]|nr:T9SS type A sorting domain-containing protein [Bacteroidota bacterium]